MARRRARACVLSLSLSLFPLKRLSRFEEVLGVFISCAYLFCLCGKKKLFKVVVVVVFLSVVSRKEACRGNASKCVEKRGKTNERKILNSSFLDTKEHYWLLLHARRKNTEYYSPRHVVPKERDEEIIARGSHNCRREEKNIVVIFSKKISPSNAARGNQRRRRGRTKSSRERLTDDGAKEMEQRTRSIVRRRKFSEQCSF